MDDKKPRESWRISDAGKCPSRQVYAKRFDADRLHGDSEREMIAIKTKSLSPQIRLRIGRIIPDRRLICTLPNCQRHELSLEDINTLFSLFHQVKNGVFRPSPHFSPGDGMIAQGFGFTRDFLKERNNSAYFRLKKIPCGFKEQARARPLVR